MSALKPYSQFRIKVRPSPESNDHEVRFLGDGDDIIDKFWNGMLGLDPDDILAAPSSLEASTKSHTATVARCSCGVIECGSSEVIIKRIADQISWSWGKSESAQQIRFLAVNYDDELRRALADTSWESPDRTAARLLANVVDRQALAEHGMTFNWGSGRLRKNKFSMSFILQPGPYQVLIHLPWNGVSPEAIVQQCVSLLRERPANWQEVEWGPLDLTLGPPALAGQGWKKSSC